MATVLCSALNPPISCVQSISSSDQIFSYLVPLYSITSWVFCTRNARQETKNMSCLFAGFTCVPHISLVSKQVTGLRLMNLMLSLLQEGFFGSPFSKDTFSAVQPNIKLHISIDSRVQCLQHFIRNRHLWRIFWRLKAELEWNIKCISCVQHSFYPASICAPFKKRADTVFQNFHFHWIFLKTKTQEYENRSRHSGAEQTDSGKRTGSRVTLGRLCTQKESSQTNEATASKVGENFSFIWKLYFCRVSKSILKQFILWSRQKWTNLNPFREKTSKSGNIC